MIHNIKNIITPVVAAAVAVMLTGCLEEAIPQNGQITENELAAGDKTALAAAMPSYFNTVGDESWDIGFGGFQIFLDAMTEDFPTHDESWDYFRYFNTQLSIGNNGLSQTFWVRYYYLLQRANAVIRMCDPTQSADRYHLGSGLVFRAFTFLDLSRMFEYRHTGVERLDAIAEQRGIWGLTVPIVTEKTTEEESRQNPRAPFWKMYRFIYTDLLEAEKYLADYHTATSKDMPCLGVVYGLQARLWLEIGSRFEMYPADLATQIANEGSEEAKDFERLGVTSANECFARAAAYARKVINEGFAPLNRSQWYDKNTGFNTPNNSWLWAIVLTSNDAITKYTWKSLTSFKAPEATYGMSGLDYSCYRMIDARLFDKIDLGDWRRDTWISPDFAGMADSEAKRQEFDAVYGPNTSYTYDKFIRFDAYAGFKFRPGSGDGATASVGNVVSVPLMRVEEMYMIEAEALAHCEGGAAGAAAIESFMNTYRMKEGSKFSCPSTQLDDVVEAIWTQKRIELWGEGQVYFDYKRRELAIVRGYPGTNHPVAYRYNSYPEATAPWTNMYIPDRVQSLNTTVLLNPDPNQAIPTLWTE